jgi:broad specificity phosphatase PhoE
VSLILVRHAMPAYEREIPPHEWPLSPEGVQAARRLVRHLPTGAFLAASDEPKAWQTLEPAGEVVRDARFGEVHRDWEPWGGPFRELRQAYVDGADHDGWESRVDVADRFDAAVADHLVRAAGRALVVASHGMAMTVWLTARVGLPAPGTFWASLHFPHAVAVDLAAGTVEPLAQR